MHAARRVARGAALGVAVAALAACALPGGGPGEDFLSLERHAWGGMCPDGPCRSDLEVAGDGSWTFTSERGSTSGRLSDADLRAMRRAVGSTSAAGAGDPDGGCAADADGLSVEYAWRPVAPDAEPLTATTCGTGPDPDDPLVHALDALADDAAAALG